MTLVLVALLSIPILTILVELFYGPGESWGHIVEHLLAGYVLNSLFLVVVSGLLALVFGVLPAWMVSRYDFPFRRFLEWALILPLAIPNYLTAYAYAGLFDYGGPFQYVMSLFADSGGAIKIDVMNIWGLAFVLSASLYPYVYVTTRSFFLNQSSSQLNSAIMLKAGEATLFWRIALPMARPAIAGGLFLVLMEVLNDYGAAYYYGVGTFTTAIFRSWFALEEPDTSVYLAALLCLFVLALILFERHQRRRKGYHERTAHARMARITSSTAKKGLLLVGCLTPVLAGFILPLVQMVYWAVLVSPDIFTSAYLTMVSHSFLLAGAAALLCVGISYMLIYGAAWSKAGRIKMLSRFAVLGYAVPGVVIAVGIMIPGLAFDRWFVRFAENQLNWTVGFVINGTVIGLLFAYCVRFLAVSYNPIEANVKKLGDSIEQASQVLGASKWRRTVEVNLPLLRKGLWSGALLVFVDVMKELPLTLLLKPYGVMTLSTRAYEFASDERIAESAIPSLMIIAVGLLPVIILNKLIRS